MKIFIFLLANQERCSDIQFRPRVRFSSSFLADVENIGLVVFWVKQTKNPPHLSILPTSSDRLRSSKLTVMGDGFCLQFHATCYREFHNYRPA